METSKCERRGFFPLARTLVSLLLFGAAFGYVEAGVVVYLRTVCKPIREQVYPGLPAEELFPALTLEHLRRYPEAMALLRVEVGREVATIVMLAAIAVASARNMRQTVSAFVIAFGAWDLFFYFWLKILLGWPPTWVTWDLLFLIPVPWTGPVIAPMIVASGMILCGTWVLWRESRGSPAVVGWIAQVLLLVGCVVIIVAFCWDYRNIMDGGVPNWFRWDLFSLGCLVCLAAFVGVLRRSFLVFGCVQ
jgi:hypothetical protein